MTVAYITSGVGTNGPTTYTASPLTITNVACGTASNTVVIGVIKGTSSIGNALLNMSVGGDTSGTTADTERTTGTDDYVRLFYWVGTGPGTANIAFTWSGDISIADAACVVYSGASGIANLTYNGDVVGSTTPAVSVTNASGDVANAVFVYGELANAITASGVKRADCIGTYYRLAVLEETGVNPSVDGTCSTIYTEARYGYSIIAAAASTQAPRSMHHFKMQGIS